MEWNEDLVIFCVRPKNNKKSNIFLSRNTPPYIMPISGQATTLLSTRPRYYTIINKEISICTKSPILICTKRRIEKNQKKVVDECPRRCYHEGTTANHPTPNARFAETEQKNWIGYIPRSSTCEAKAVLRTINRVSATGQKTQTVNNQQSTFYKGSKYYEYQSYIH